MIYIHIKFVFITYVCVFNPVNYLTIYQLKLNKNNIITNKKIFFNIYIYIFSPCIFIYWHFWSLECHFFQFEYFLILIFIFYCWNINHIVGILIILHLSYLYICFCSYLHYFVIIFCNLFFYIVFQKLLYKTNNKWYKWCFTITIAILS